MAAVADAVTSEVLVMSSLAGDNVVSSSSDDLLMQSTEDDDDGARNTRSDHCSDQHTQTPGIL